MSYLNNDERFSNRLWDLSPELLHTDFEKSPLSKVFNLQGYHTGFIKIKNKHCHYKEDFSQFF